MMTKIGMPFCRAPEMFDSVYDQKVDIWSVGIITYQLIAGRLPFEADYEVDLMKKIANENPDYNGFSIWEQDIL